MARRKAEKVVVLKENLPALSLLADGTYGYVLRYRIISEDGAIFSDWSPTSQIPFDTGLSAVMNIDIVFNDTSLSLIWDDVFSVSAYDIFTAWDGGDYVYHGTSPIHTYSITIPNLGYSTLDVVIQAASVNRVIDTTESIRLAQATGLDVSYAVFPP